MPDTLASEITAPEIRTITPAVAITFCRGNRRPSANRVELVANTSNHASSQPPRRDESICRKLKTKLASQQQRQAMKIGLCQGCRDGEGKAISGPAALPTAPVACTSGFPGSVIGQIRGKRSPRKPK